ncbi:amidohydrolase [Paraburkholderia sediminicola]|uniref:amidohydrolase family protein n=1 Tax=Paraburkholderia sediminicola TaxID=458836 RepID=UPI0038BAB17F
MLAITNATIVTMDPQRRVIEDGAVIVEGQRIVAVGTRALLASEYDLRDAIDGKGGVITPGLIDGHNHPSNYLVGGYGDDLDVFTLLSKVFYPFESLVTADETVTGALATFAEMIRSGVTCFNDPGGYMPDQIGEAARSIGIRGIICRSTRDLGGHYGEDNTDDAFAKAIETADKWQGQADGRLRGWLGIRVPSHASDELIVRVSDAARSRGVGLHTHASAAEFEHRQSIATFGKRTLERFHDLGILGPNLFVVHMGFIDEREIEWVVQHHVKVAHCPIASLTGAWGIIKRLRIPEMMKRGVTVCLGSDTNFGSGSLDMFRQMFFCATGHREAHDDPSLIGAQRALEMATIDSARALLWDDEIGSIEIGKKADLVLMDRSHLEWHYPGRDTVRSLVYGGSRADVRTVVIDGRVVLRDGVLMTVNEHDLALTVSAAGKAWRSRTATLS